MNAQVHTFCFTSVFFLTLTGLTTVCQSLECLCDDNNSVKNMTCKSHIGQNNMTDHEQHGEGHCITMRNSSSLDWTYAWDDFFCNDKQPNVFYHICHEGQNISFTCCNSDLCNKKQCIVDNVHLEFECPKVNSPCPFEHCINSTMKNGTHSSIDCFYDQNANCSHTENTTFVQLNKDVLQSQWTISCFNTCTHAYPHSPTNHPATAPSKVTTSGIPKAAGQKQNFSVGVGIGAVLVLCAGLVLIGVGVKKCYDRHRNKRLEYSYAQLTIDMLDDDDDHLILP